MGHFLDTFALLYFLLIFVMRSTFKRYKRVNSLFLQLIFPQIARALDINRKCRIPGKDFLGGISKVYTKVHLGLSNTTFEYNEYVQRYISIFICMYSYIYIVHATLLIFVWNELQACSWKLQINGLKVSSFPLPQYSRLFNYFL